MWLAADPRVRMADQIGARYGLDPAVVLEEPDPRRRAVRVAAFITAYQR